MAAKRLRARILRGVMIFLAGLLFLLLAQPLWFPWILRPLAQRYGISYANSARKSYGRLVLNDVSFTNRTARFHAEKAEMFIPTAWLWHRWLRREQVPYLRVDNWKLDFGPGPRGARPQLSVYTNVVQVASTLAKIKEWIPKAILTNGIIQIPVKVPAGFG